MIFITGDIHGELKRFSKYRFPEQFDLTKEDVVIILGDFGMIWCNEEDKEEKYNLEMLENKAFTTVFVDGNHENFDRLKTFPVVEWNGGQVHEIRPNIYHLMRGQIYSIEGKSFFSFGGAASHDISGCASNAELKADYTAGVLRRDDPKFEEKRKYCDREFLFYRIEGESWWRDEMPSDEEMRAGTEMLEKVGWKVDYVLTHECPTSTLACFSKDLIGKDMLTEYLESIKQKLDYKTWYFGHHHADKDITDKDIMLYREIRKI